MERVLKLTILHTNDIHGRVDGLARVATVVERVRAETAHRVLYVDAGDVEETTTWISNVTKGAAMHRLLSAARCEVSVVGNASWLRYGAHVLPDHAAAATYPLLLANLRAADGSQLPGTRNSALLGDAGFIGVTDPMRSFHGHNWDELFGLSELPVEPLVREEAAALRAAGARLVVLLSHMGLERDRELAAALEGHVDLVIGGHTHDLLPEGERVGAVLVAAAGEWAQHVGRIDVDGGDVRASVIPVEDTVELHPAVLAAVEAAEAEVQAILSETIGELDRPLDGQWVAEAVRRRMGADVGLATEAAALSGTLPPGPVRRGELWAICDSSGNPGVAEISGDQLAHVLARGADPEFMATTHHVLRGRPRGRLFVAGCDRPEPGRTYRVAGTDWELEPYGGMVEREWGVHARYDFPTILREALEDALRGRR